jgi:hypothetical protein
MSKNEIKSLFISGIIFATALAFILRYELIDTAQAIQIIISFVLVLITAIYVKRTAEIAKAAKEQTEASIKMAEEMREQRYDAVRPVIDIVIMKQSMKGEELIKQGLDAKEGKLPKDLPCKLRNVGVGPAIELYSFIEGIEDAEGNPRRWDFGTLPVAIGKEEMGYTHEMRLLLMQRGSHRALVAYYKDVYGNPFESIREVSVNKDKDAVNIDPLKVRPLSKKEHTE